MEHLIDTSFDKDLSNIDGLTWLPWIGNNYKNNTRRLLIVGESAYLGKEHYKDNDEEYQNLFFKSTEDKLTITFESKHNPEQQKSGFSLKSAF